MTTKLAFELHRGWRNVQSPQRIRRVSSDVKVRSSEVKGMALLRRTDRHTDKVYTSARVRELKGEKL